MSNVEFDENNGAQSYPSNQVPPMTAWLLKKGIIKEESQAKGILLTVVVVNFILAIAIFFFFV
ncbi:MAG: hypothetical protein ABI430_00845 [Candidatus Taylorbacteria bacterium]